MESKLRQRIAEIAEKARFTAVAVAVHDYESGTVFSEQGDRWFHAASVIKVAILVALYKSAQEGRLRLDERLHVRNRFRSVADGSIYRIDRERDADSLCHQRIGRAMKLAELSEAMITRSSNLATNLLLDLLTLPLIHDTLAQAGITGVRVVRGVEDHVAHQQGLNNEMTANGTVQLFKLLCEGEFFNHFSRQQMRDILIAQEFDSMLPARLPSGVKVAHKTGEISTHCHDAGVVYFPDRKPYIVAILSEGPPLLEQRQRSIAEISEAVFQAVIS
jgi:beta-lactamase class A